jgi:hypothetical protein
VAYCCRVVNKFINIVARTWRLYKTGFGLTSGFIGSQYSYSVPTTVDLHTRLRFTVFNGNGSSACVPLHCLFSAETLLFRAQDFLQTHSQSPDCRLTVGSHSRPTSSLKNLQPQLTLNQVKVTLRPTISRSVSPGFEPHLGLVTGH